LEQNHKAGQNPPMVVAPTEEEGGNITALVLYKVELLIQTCLCNEEDTKL